MSSGERVRPRLLSERVADRLGLTWLATRFGRPGAAPYLVPTVGLVVDFAVLSSISYVTTDRSWFVNVPAAVILAVGLLGGVWLGRWLRGRYATAVRNLPGEELTADQLLDRPGLAVQVGFALLFHVGYVVENLASPSEVSAFVAIHGEAVTVATWIVPAAFYYVVYGDVASIVFASLLQLPWRISRTDLSLDFSDVRGFAGLYPVSRLLQSAAGVYFTALTVWTVFTVLPVFLGNAAGVSAIERTVFPLYWIVGVLLYAAPVYLLHRHIAAKKEALIDEIDADIRSLDPDGKERGIPYFEPNEADRPLLQQRFVELQQVKSTREYPANVTILQELGFAALLPVGLQLLASSIAVPV